MTETYNRLLMWLQTREKKTSKMDKSGLSMEELMAAQEELFKSANEKYNQGPV